ncbi:MAG: DJ-1/PfpI family protein [Proteobacteria bacterium]|nr:DJ-1/PfpI family protein [Pseudomonadota bacterium]
MSRQRIALLLYPGCIFFEVAAALELLAPACTIVCLTPDGTEHAASNGLRIAADASFDGATDRAWSCVLVPGGDPDAIFEAGRADACLIAAHRHGALLAGICAGSLVLARTGLLRGRRVTHNYTAEYAEPERVACTAPYWNGSIHEPADVVVDLPFITAQHWAHEAFAAAVAQALGVLTASEAAAWLARRRAQAGTLGSPASAIASSDSS